MRGVGESVGSAVFGTLGRVVARTQEQRGLPVDLLESDEAFLAIFDAPGVHSSDIRVRFEDNTVAVELDRFRAARDDYRMRYPGRGLTLDGQTTLPADATVDPTGATAVLRDDGTLHIRLPKTDDETNHDKAIIDPEDSTASNDETPDNAE